MTDPTLAALPDLTPDCAKCAALCCVSLAFDSGDAFAIDKPAGTPCPHLAKHHCSIHADLPARGFAGCTAYSCNGAGQRVTQALFNGQSWRDTPALLAPMMRAFADMRAVHECLLLLTAAAALPLGPQDATTRQSLTARLAPDHLTQDSFADFGTSPLAREIDLFIASLRRYIAAP